MEKEIISMEGMIVIHGQLYGPVRYYEQFESREAAILYEETKLTTTKTNRKC